MRFSRLLLRSAIPLAVVIAAGCDSDVDSLTAPTRALTLPSGSNANIANLTTLPIRYSQTSALNDLRAFTGDGIPVLMADDFVVPEGEVWTITAFSLTGNLYASALPLSIHPDVGGIPGAPLPNANYAITPTANDPNECACTYWAGFTITDYLFPLPTPITLTAGKYWLAARTGDPGNVLVFNWQAHLPVVGSGSALWGIVDMAEWRLASMPGDNSFVVFGTMKPTQTITFTSTVPSPVYPAQSYSVSATGGPSGNPVTFSSLTPNVCSVSGSNVLFLGWGDCTVAADQAGNETYGAAVQATQTIAVTRYSQTITFTPMPPAAAPLGSTITLTATGGASYNPVVFRVETPGYCSVVGSQLTLIYGGMCNVSAFQAGDAMYAPAGKLITIAVLWPFTGFVGLAAEPAVNVVRAGSSVPLTFSLGGNQGLFVLAAGSPTVAPYVCNGTVPAPGSGIPLPLAKNGALAYSTKTGQYTITWKPEKREQSCRLVSIRLTDGTVHTARFQLQ